MKINDFKGAIVTEQWDNKFIVESVYGLKFECYEGSEIFDYLYKNLKFQEFVNNIINKEYSEEELKEIHFMKISKYANDKLKEDIKVSKPKITIKIELEKYEK